MRESIIEKSVLGYARTSGWLVRKLKWIGRTGAPDRYILKGGKTILIEFKSTDGVLRPDQIREIKRLRKFGGAVHVISGIEEGFRLIDSLG